MYVDGIYVDDVGNVQDVGSVDKVKKATVVEICWKNPSQDLSGNTRDHCP